MIRSNHGRYVFMSASWVLGILLGTLSAVNADDSLLAMMRRAADSQVSIVTLLLSAVLPFLIAAYAVFINRYAIFYAVCAGKAFAFSYCAAVIFRAFGSAGWLVQPLLQFSDTVLSILFCWFCFRRCGGDRFDGKADLAVCMIISAAVVVIDSLLVSSFLGTLI